MEALLHNFLDKYLNDLLTIFPMEVLAGTLKRCMKDGLKIFQKHPAEEFSEGIPWGFSKLHNGAICKKKNLGKV